ncbi:5'-nucleotidase C-terminal domain-containing protein [Jeotgalibacillus terrae]|uniref:5'-nucleotidase C-terminal domain-containing protein n=1 Tax=Jeotgalibacillus terrae TaxID=587735 RepID=A0ABW5ZEL1_9BACL|nr:5'-nucleotidase C-terminal domain-containing protein [Jeotgalibacillus terrae]MBM7577806.1 2',3'-cyclic-nucleotide 2'-phosphodiesterase (5'-nucleotidase family) [Jeotgalibacillus terrae]
MKKKLLMTSVAGAMAVSVFGFQAAETHADNHEFELRVLHTNDTHANLDNVAKRVKLVKDLKAEMPENNLLLDAGDVFSGTLYFNEFFGQADLAFMNLMGYDAMTFGNHEFDKGTNAGHPELSAFVQGAEFPFVASNVDFSGDTNFDGLQSMDYTAEFENGEIYNGIIKEVNGEKVGIFGLTTQETENISSPESVTFSNYITAAEEAVAEFEAAGVNKIIALTHIGYNDNAALDNDRVLAQEVEGIDIIVGGHTHFKLDEPEKIGDTLIVQTEGDNKQLGQLDVTFDDEGVVSSYEGMLHDVRELTEEDTEAAEMLVPYSEAVEDLKNEVTGGESEVFLQGTREEVRTGETNLGNLITDAMLDKAQSIDQDTVIALQNGGGIRASIPAGEITLGEVLTVMPFGNDLAIMELSGAEILEALEHSVSQYPTPAGAFLHVAGMQFAFDPSMEAGSRVQEAYVWMGDEAVMIEEDEMYKVATNVFTAKGGDDFEVFAEAYADGRVSEPGFRDYETFAEYIAELGTFAPEEENRIVALTPFEDVMTDNWYQSYVADLYYGGILNGKTDTMFDSLGTLSRAQAASLIVRSLELTTEEEASFSDLENVAESTQAEIAAAAANGIVNGIDGEFRPYEPVTRSQLALMLYRAYMVDGDEFTPESTDYFSDVEGWGEETNNAVSFVYETGIASGYGDQYRPLAFSTRAQAAKMISVFLDVETMQ